MNARCNYMVAIEPEGRVIAEEHYRFYGKYPADQCPRSSPPYMREIILNAQVEGAQQQAASLES